MVSRGAAGHTAAPSTSRWTSGWHTQHLFVADHHPCPGFVMVGALQSALMLSMYAGLCSAFGGALPCMFRRPGGMELWHVAVGQASVGAAILCVACCDILPEAAMTMDGTRACAFFLLGLSGAAAAARFLRSKAVLPFLDHYRLAARNAGRPPDVTTEILLVGMVTFCGVAVHNLLEGLSIFVAANCGIERSVRLLTAVSLENAPEGLSIAIPVYYVTRKRSTAIRLALLSGMVEPLGVLLMGIFLREGMSQTAVGSVQATIAGILGFVAAAEMLPLAVYTVGTSRLSSLSSWMGAGVIAATICQPLLMYHARVDAVQ